MADLLVDGFEVVEVDDHEREPPAVALCAGDLPRQRFMEVAPVVQAGQCIQVGKPARLAEAKCIRDRRARAPREVFELGAADFGTRARIRSEEAQQHRLVVERQGERGAHLSFFGAFRVAVRDGHRLSTRPGRCGERLSAGLLERHAERGDDRLRLVSRFDRDDGRVDPVDIRRGIE